MATPLWVPVGVLSERTIVGQAERFCNLGAGVSCQTIASIVCATCTLY
jgi:hypothetical protein